MDVTLGFFFSVLQQARQVLICICKICLGKMKMIFALSAVLTNTLMFQTDLFYVQNFKLGNY